MSTTLLSSARPSRFVCLLIAAMFGIALALNPMSTAKAEAAVSATTGARALHVSALQIGVWYRYGGTNPRTGFDCSGLTQYSWARVGKHLPRTAQQQYNATIHIGARSQRGGDLVFFYSGSSIDHEGMYAGNGYMIVARHTGTRVQKQRIWTTHVHYGRVR